MFFRLPLHLSRQQQPDNGQNPENQQNSLLHQQVAKSLKKICCSTTYSTNFKQVNRQAAGPPDAANSSSGNSITRLQLVQSAKP
jgi:hypothetical protein